MLVNGDGIQLRKLYDRLTINRLGPILYAVTVLVRAEKAPPRELESIISEAKMCLVEYLNAQKGAADLDATPTIRDVA